MVIGVISPIMVLMILTDRIGRGSASSGSIESDFIDGYLARRGKERLHRIITAMNVRETLGSALGALLGGGLPAWWARLFPGDNKYDGKRPTEHGSLEVFLRGSLSLVKSSKALRLLLVGIVLLGFSFVALNGGYFLMSVVGTLVVGYLISASGRSRFVASVSSCHMLTFLFLAYWDKRVIRKYSDAAIGYMEKDEAGRE